MPEQIEPLRLWMLLGPLIVAAAALLCAILAKRLRPLLMRHALARPNARSTHREPTPQGGGIAVIAAATALPLVTVIFFPFLRPAGIELWSLMAATVLIASVGLIDDMHAIEVAPRLFLQTVAVALAISFLPDSLRVLPALPLYPERVLLILGGVWFVDLVNFMDGMDWMTIAEAVPIVGALIVLGLMHSLPPYAVLVALALLGGLLGFAPFNQPVARLFLGDVGSLPIGLLLGWLLVLLAGAGHLGAALLLPLYYLADASVTLVLRLIKREKIWLAHRSHFYQRAVDRGFPVYVVVGSVFVLNVLLAVLAIAAVYLNSHHADLPLLLLGGILVSALLIFFVHGTVSERT